MRPLSAPPLRKAERAQSLRLDSRGVGPAAYARWRAQEPLVTSLYETTGDPSRFYAKSDTILTTSLSVMRYDFGPLSYLRGAAQARRDGADGVIVQLLETDGYVADFDGRGLAPAAGSAVFNDMGRPMGHLSASGTGWALLLSRDAFKGADVAALHGACVGPARFRLLRDYVSWMHARLPQAAPSRLPSAGRAAAEVVLACFGSAPTARAVRALGSVARARAESYMAEHLGDPKLSTEATARAAGVSRATLYRLFAGHGGVDARLWELRLEAARAALSDPDREGRVGQIAASFGFVTLQHFSRRFSAHYGFSPRNLRPF